MNNFSHFEFENFVRNDAVRFKEKQQIKKCSNLVSVAYIILWLIPYLFSRVVSDMGKLFGITEVIKNLYDDPAFIMLLQTLLSVVMFTLPFLIVPAGLGRKTKELISFGLPEKNLFLPLLLAGAGTSAFANIATNIISGLFSSVGIEFLSPEIEYPRGIFGFLLSFTAIAIVPALVEEFAIRGIVMGSSKEFGEGFALAVSSVIFAMMHGNFVQIPFALIMGAVIGFAVIKTGSIWTGIAIHFVNNAVSVIMNYVTEDMESVVLQSVIMVIYYAVCTLCFFVGILLAHKSGCKVWTLEKSESALSVGEKTKYFFLTPFMIVAIILTVISCLDYIYIV